MQALDQVMTGWAITIYMLCEPEAAALATFKTMPLYGPEMQIKVRRPIFSAKEHWLILTV